MSFAETAHNHNYYYYYKVSQLSNWNTICSNVNLLNVIQNHLQNALVVLRILTRLRYIDLIAGNLNWTNTTRKRIVCLQEAQIIFPFLMKMLDKTKRFFVNDHHYTLVHTHILNFSPIKSSVNRCKQANAWILRSSVYQNYNVLLLVSSQIFVSIKLKLLIHAELKFTRLKSVRIPL